MSGPNLLACVPALALLAWGLLKLRAWAIANAPTAGDEIRARLGEIHTQAEDAGEFDLAEALVAVQLLWAGGYAQEAAEALEPLLRQHLKGERPAAPPSAYSPDPAVFAADLAALKDGNWLPVERYGERLGYLRQAAHPGSIINLTAREAACAVQAVTLRRVGRVWVTLDAPEILAHLPSTIYRPLGGSHA